MHGACQLYIALPGGQAAGGACTSIIAQPSRWDMLTRYGGNTDAPDHSRREHQDKYDVEKQSMRHSKPLTFVITAWNFLGDDAGIPKKAIRLPGRLSSVQGPAQRRAQCRRRRR